MTATLFTSRSLTLIFFNLEIKDLSDTSAGQTADFQHTYCHPLGRRDFVQQLQ
ncbi:hypothetical protein ECDEC10A_2575 [Escherichia coli DEC10A]|nr:hypothetical protein ECDEC10A_2575 [Escherichia coli DEC10A]